MGTFVSGNTPLPPAKQDAYPPTGLATELDASDINDLWSAAGDLRTSVFGFRPVINVKAPPYSAVGNGIVDDTNAWLAAIADAQTARGTLYVPAGIYKITAPLATTGINLIGEGGAAFTAANTHTEVDYYGAGACLTFASTSNGGGSRLEGLAFVSKAASQTGVIVEQTFGLVRNIGIKGFDTVGFQMGVASVVGAYYTSVDNLLVTTATTQCAIGVLVSGGVPSTNANSFRNVVVNGKFTTMIQIDGTKNIFIGGDVDPDTRGTGVSNMWLINGIGNDIVGSYSESGGGGAPGKYITFGAASSANTVRDIYLSFAMTNFLNQTNAITDLGLSNKVSIRPTGFNFPFISDNRGVANFVPNSGFQQWDSVAGAPYGWVNIGGAGTAVQDTTTTHGTATSLKLTGAAQNVLWGAFFASPGDRSLNQVPIGYFQGKQVTCSVWCKSSFAGQGNVRVTMDGTGGTAFGQMTHTGSGNWELLLATGLVPLDATKVGIHVRNTNGGGTLTGDIWFSEPMCVVGPAEVPHYLPRPVADTMAQLMGPLIEAPPFSLAYGLTVATDASQGNSFLVTVNDGVAFTMSNPTNLKLGQRVLYTFKNTSAGAMGVITWGTTFKTAAFTAPGTLKNRSVEFLYNGTNLVQLYQSALDVPN